MKGIYANFKFTVGDTVWVCCDGHPVQCEITDRHRSTLGVRAYLVALPVAEGEPKLQIKFYDCEVFATKEELCHMRMGRLNEEIAEIEANCKEEIAKKRAAIQRWEAFEKEKTNERKRI